MASEKRTRFLRRTSSRLIAAAIAIAVGALASTMYLVKLQREFSAPTAITIGSVLRKGAVVGKSRRSHSEWFCWVRYEFSPPGGAKHTGWGMWQDACGLKNGGPVAVQYVVAHPDINRPPEGGPPISPLFFWFAAGVLLVIGVIRRGSDET